MTDLIRDHIRAVIKFEEEHEERTAAVLADYEAQGYRIVSGGQTGPHSWEVTDYRTGQLIIKGDNGLDGYDQAAAEHGANWAHIDPITEHLFDIPDPITPGIPESLREVLATWVRSADAEEIEEFMNGESTDSETAVSPDAMRTDHDVNRVSARVLLVFGGWAELVTEERDHTDPVRVSAARVTEDTGIPVNALPGKSLTVVLGDDGDPERFEAVSP